MEYIDILNDKGELTGEVASREDVHRAGHLHKVIHVLVINSKGELLIQKRTPNKEKNPNMWDISCAGHLSSGNTSIEGAIREFQEELGIKIESSDIKLIYSLKRSYIPKQEFIENEIQDVYLCKKDIDINDVKVQKEEVAEVKYIPFELYVENFYNKNKDFVYRGEEYKNVIEIVSKELKSNKM